MAVHPFHWVGRAEGQRPRQHLVENDAERIEIAAGIDRAVHPSGLFRRHIGKRAGDNLGRRRRLVLAGQPRGDAKARQPDAAAGGVDQDIGGLEVLMNQPARVRLPDGLCQRNGNAQERFNLEGRAGHPVERPAARILEHQQHPSALIPQLQRTYGPSRVELSTQGVLVLHSLGDGSWRMVTHRHDDQDRCSRPLAPAACKPHLPIFSEQLDNAQ